MNMAIADELNKLETNRANIVAAINGKGGSLETTAPLSACPDAITNLPSGDGGSSSSIWTGHIDEEGLRYIGWDEDDIATLKGNICWDEDEDENYVVPQDHKDLWDKSEKVEVDGKLMLKSIAAATAMGTKLRYLPKVHSSTETVPFESGWKCQNLIAMPKLDLSSCTSVFNCFANVCHLLYLDFVLPVCTDCSYTFSGASINATKINISAPNATNIPFLFNGISAQKVEIYAPAATSATRLFRASNIRYVIATLGSCTNYERMLDIVNNECTIYLNDTDFTKIISSASLPAPNSSYTIPNNTASNFRAIKTWFESMLKGVPNYTADSYPMYFRSGSTVDDDADGTLQGLVDQCTEMGWAIYNLTINTYTT